MKHVVFNLSISISLSYDTISWPFNSSIMVMLAKVDISPAFTVKLFLGEKAVAGLPLVGDFLFGDKLLIIKKEGVIF